MEIRVLGSLEVESSAGRRLPIGSSKQRELLALLAANAPQVVSADRLIDALWGDVDDDRHASLRFHVSKLRAAIDPDRTELPILTQPPGYRLDTDVATVDAHRFVALVVDAEARATVDPLAARPMLEEASRMWRGLPYVEFEYAEWAQTEIVRLRELWLLLTALRLDTDLESGRHDEVVAELESLVLQYPLQERFWRQLMLALHRSGRQPEALRAYRRACDAFGDVGTVPADELTDLEHRILVRDPALDSTRADGASGNLPAPLSSFVGRDREVAAVRELAVRHRLVTLVGPGGVGKSRLAIEAAHELERRFDHGVWLVELAGVDEAMLVPSQIADALGVAGGSAGDLLGRLVDFLHHRGLLLVLDNCEHLAADVSTVVADLLTGCPELHVLVTSRMPLGIEAECTWRTEPLALADDDQEGSELASSPPAAVQLFHDRASAAQPALVLTAEDRTVMADVCRRLGGLPLAIEIAAARLRMMSLDHLSQRLDDQFALLTNGPSLAVDHHRAMLATLDWSYRLLDASEQALFRRLAVFRGGFTLEAAERFHEQFPHAQGNALQLLGRLVDASMVEAVPGDRYRMLEPIRQFGLLALDEQGEIADAHGGHGAVLREAFRIGDDDLYGPPAVGNLMDVRFATEINNVRAALVWAIESVDTAAVVELGSTAGCLFADVGYFVEADHWFNRVLEATSHPSHHRARALARGAFISAVLHGRERGERYVDELELVAERLDDDRWRAAAVERRALFALMRDDIDTATTLWDEATERLLDLGNRSAWLPLSNHMEALLYAGNLDGAEAVAQRLAAVGERFDLPAVVADSLVGRSFIAVDRGDADGAEQHLRAAEQCAGSAFHVGGALGVDRYGSALLPGFIALLRGDLDEAERLASAAITPARRSRQPDNHLRGLVLLGLIHLQRGDPLTGHRFLVEELTEAVQHDLVYFQRYVLGAIAATGARIDPPRGAILIGAVEAIIDRDESALPVPIAHAAEDARTWLAGALRPEELDEALRRGSEMAFDDAVALGLALEAS